MQRSSRLVLGAAVLAAAVGIYACWPVERSFLGKLRTLRKGMSMSQVEAVLGTGHDNLPGWGYPPPQVLGYRGGPTVSSLFSSKSPFVHPLAFWRSSAWSAELVFEKSAEDGDLRLRNVYWYSSNDIELSRAAPKNREVFEGQGGIEIPLGL